MGVGNVVNIDKYLGNVKSRINRLGVELEGGWTHIPDGAALEHDGSVVINKRVSAGAEPIRAGEIPSPPKLPVEMWRWMRKHYPPHINETCGLHVHMSFNKLKNYMRLMDSPDYQATMIEYLKRWAKAENLPEEHSIWNRLDGKNRYCTLDYWPDLQAQQTRKVYNHDAKGHRYTAINYCFNKEGCQTIECRVLPMFESVEQAIRAVQRVRDVTDAYLVARAKKDDRVAAEFKISAGLDTLYERSFEVIR